MEIERLKKFGMNIWFVLVGGLVFNFRLAHEWGLVVLFGLIVLVIAWKESK